jgi:hypothetical protein
MLNASMLNVVEPGPDQLERRTVLHFSPSTLAFLINIRLDSKIIVRDKCYGFTEEGKSVLKQTTVNNLIFFFTPDEKGK